MGWRYQIPALLQLGLRVVVPDCLGYGRTVLYEPLPVIPTILPSELLGADRNLSGCSGL